MSSENKPAIATSIVAFAALVSWAFTVFVLSLSLPAVAALGWEETRCTILDSNLDRRKMPYAYQRMKTTKDYLQLRYRYQVGERFYASDRYNFRDENADPDDVPAPGETVTCYYDADDPREAVIDRSIPLLWLSLGLLALSLYLGRVILARIIRRLRGSGSERDDE